MQLGMSAGWKESNFNRRLKCRPSSWAILTYRLRGWPWRVGDWRFGVAICPECSDEDSIAAIHLALTMGVELIDTAAIYGVGHRKRWSGGL